MKFLDVISGRKVCRGGTGLYTDRAIYADGKGAAWYTGQEMGYNVRETWRNPLAAPRIVVAGGDARDTIQK